MADTTATTADLDFNLKDYIHNEENGIIPLVNAIFKITKQYYEQKAEKQLKDNKLVIGDQQPIGLTKIQAMKTEVIEKIRNLPKVWAASERAKKAKKSAERRANMDPAGRQQPPSIFTSELVNFFMNADLGSKPDGTGRLQDLPEMQHFFKNGVANLTFGVSLLNVWGYRNKLTGTDHHRVILDANAKKHLGTAIEKLRLKKMANIEKARASGNAKAIENAEKELARFNEGEIQNKDYMTLFIEYKNPKQPEKEKLMAFTEVVSVMSDITKSRNEYYKAQLKAEHPKVAAEPVKRSAPSPVRKSSTLVAVKKTEPVATIPSMSIPTAPARAASPAASGKKTKKSEK
jgi:hypothetical protein